METMAPRVATPLVNNYWHDNYFTLHFLGLDDLDAVLRMLSSIVAKYEAIALVLKVSPEGKMKEKYERDLKTLEKKGNLDIVITNWLQSNKPSWRKLAHVMYKSIDESRKVRIVYRKIVKEHPKKKKRTET